MYYVTYTDSENITHTAVLASADAGPMMRLINEKPARWWSTFREMMEDEISAHVMASNYAKAEKCCQFMEALADDALWG